jgi:glycerol kinase
MKLANLNNNCLPSVVDSFSNIGEIQKGDFTGIPIGCILGDQQASAYAHNLQKNHIKCSYGTGCFLIMNLGNEPKIFDNFVTTILHKNGDNIEYGL